MTLLELKTYIERLPKNWTLQHSLSYPFSWRGVYAEVAFAVDKDLPMTREEQLARIEKAYTDTFEGWKGGKYRYDSLTEVHFEADTGSYTDGEYIMQMLGELGGTSKSLEHQLLDLVFTPITPE